MKRRNCSSSQNGTPPPRTASSQDGPPPPRTASSQNGPPPLTASMHPTAHAPPLPAVAAHSCPNSSSLNRHRHRAGALCLSLVLSRRLLFTYRRTPAPPASEPVPPTAPPFLASSSTLAAAAPPSPSNDLLRTFSSVWKKLKVKTRKGSRLEKKAFNCSDDQKLSRWKKRDNMRTKCTRHRRSLARIAGELKDFPVITVDTLEDLRAMVYLNDGYGFHGTIKIDSRRVGDRKIARHLLDQAHIARLNLSD